MSYDVLSDDLYEKGGKDKKSKKKNRKKFKFNPLYLHALFLIGILGFLFFYFMPLNTNTDKIIGNIDLVAQLDNFSKSYSGNISFYSKDFVLQTKDTFKGVSKDFFIENFNGEIYLENNSIVFEGTGNKIKYDKNNINIANSNFKLISKRKTTFKGHFKEFDLFVLDGNLKIDNSLNHKFTNSNIKIYDINASVIYDGIFSISGIAKKFTFKSDQQKLMITFENE